MERCSDFDKQTLERHENFANIGRKKFLMVVIKIQNFGLIQYDTVGLVSEKGE